MRIRRVCFFAQAVASGGISEALQVQGTENADTIDLSRFTTDAAALVTVTGHAQADTITLNTTAVEHVYAVTGAQNGIRVVMGIDNGTDSRVYFWGDGTNGGTANSIIETSELILLATLEGVADVSGAGVMLV